MHNFIDLRPIPRGIILRTNIIRNNSGSNKNSPEYYVFINQHPRFLLSAKKIQKLASAYYTISLSKTSFKKDDSYIGKLRSNFLGTEFHLYDNGVNPKKTEFVNDWRNILASVVYEANLLGFNGPRKMKVYLPGINEKEEINLFRDRKDNEKLIYQYEKNDSKIILFRNKLPKWNEKAKAYVLEFDGRVERGSVKNFQLCDPLNENFIYLQFGRIDDSTFCMDLKYPLSPIQAFGICLASFDN